jgi:Flp pilus assembly protein TadD
MPRGGESFSREKVFMKADLVDIERKALEARNGGDIREAARLFAAIAKEQPDWDHGSATYNLACCYEDLGELSSAEQHFREALKYEPENDIFLGGLASFLYLHGDPAEAFDRHLALLRVERKNRDHRRAETTKIALEALGKRLGLSDEAIAEKLR